jgi:hypothetical protein
MTAPSIIRHNGQSLTIRVPMKFRKIGGCRRIITPDGAPVFAPVRAAPDSTISKALGRAYRWKKMLETGKHGSIADLAKAEKINESYLCRVLRLTLLAPDIVEQILDGQQSLLLQINDLLGPWPMEWREQRERMGRYSDL